MQLDGPVLVLALAGLGVAVVVAVLVGTLTARLFFHASRSADTTEPHDPS